jgi:cytochrome c oxidase subunit 2
MRVLLYLLFAFIMFGLVGGLGGCGGREAEEPTAEEEVTEPEKPEEKPEEVAEKPDMKALIEQGKELYSAQGCMGCHTTDGSPSVGPTFKGLYGSERELEDGTKVEADEAYIKESIIDPKAKIVKGYAAIMPAYQLSEEELKALIEFIKSLSE